MKLTFCDARKCHELTSLSHSPVLPVNNKKYNKSFLSIVKFVYPFSPEKARMQRLQLASRNVFIFGILSVDEIRTMPFRPTPVPLDTARRCNGDKIESASSRFHDDCKGQVRSDRQNDYDRHGG